MSIPEYHLIKLDERRYWTEDVQKKVKEIYGVYAFNVKQATYVCELTPSRELLFVGTDFVPEEGLSPEEVEKLEAIISEADVDPVTYMHVRTVEALQKQFPERTRAALIDPEVDDSLDERTLWNRRFDQLIEGWHTGAISF